MSGGIAQADVLGIFGREGMFAAALWPDANIPFIAGAFEMYRNFDGHDGAFGDTSVRATTSNVDASSIYASLDSKHPGLMVLVLINKTFAPLPAVLNLHHVARVQYADVYQLTEHAPEPQPAGKLDISQGGALNYLMPAFSVSTVKFTFQGQP
jgi:hypothetical protein